MKKLMALCLSMMLVLLMVGCGEKTIKGSELYGFPEPTTEIKVIYSHGTTDEEYILTDDDSVRLILNWFYGLELSEVTDELELVAGNEVYAFYVKDKLAFSYDNWGISAYLYVNDKVYEVKNPSVPPYHKEESESSNPFFSKSNNWGITLSVKDVAPIGMTLLITQSGGDPTGELQCGSDYHLKVLENDEWIDVPYIVEGDVAWTAEAYMVPLDDSVEMEITWEYLYGELKAGTYQISKGFMDFRGSGDFDSDVIYTEFEIE